MRAFSRRCCEPGRTAGPSACTPRNAGESGGTVCMPAENGGVIDVLVQRALAAGQTAPRYHALTRPARAEAEATHRAIALAEIADVPIYLVHLPAAGGAGVG